MQTHQCTVLEEHHGLRLDKFLVAAIPSLTRNRIQTLLAGGGVHFLGAPIDNASKKVKAGEVYELTEPDTVALDLTPTKMDLDIVHEDGDILVLNKPAGLTVHPAPGNREGTLVHALLAHCGDSLSGIGGVARPGIVHRIDKDTSGLLVIAKNDAAHQHLSAQLKSRTLKRTYLAYCWGATKQMAGTVEAPLARNPHKRKEMAVVKTGKHAVTHYATLERYRAGATTVATKIECELDTGRTHQIRVHMAHLGNALIGDPVYGPSTQTRLNRLKSHDIVLSEETVSLLLSFDRQALHARQLVLCHPKTGLEMTFEAPISADLKALEAGLASLTK
ncbi:MAG: RluA family pseudouridine synthase [Alphaproteobacteria bacterium]|nr:RluA family pseudouridine synthase [Alphaproteobacteria bacterium]